MPLWDGKFCDRPSMLGIHWIRSLMTCYLAATRRWITRTKLTPPPPLPHAGPSENNAILEDQLKTHRRRQTQTKKKKGRQTHTDLNILREHAAPTSPPHRHPLCRLWACEHAPFFLCTSVGHRRTNTSVDTQKDLAATQNTHCRSFICLCFILWAASTERTSNSEELSIKSAQRCPIVLILVAKVRSHHAIEKATSHSAYRAPALMSHTHTHTTGGCGFILSEGVI